MRGLSFILGLALSGGIIFVGMGRSPMAESLRAQILGGQSTTSAPQHVAGSDIDSDLPMVRRGVHTSQGSSAEMPVMSTSTSGSTSRKKGYRLDGTRTTRLPQVDNGGGYTPQTSASRTGSGTRSQSGSSSAYRSSVGSKMRSSRSISR